MLSLVASCVKSCERNLGSTSFSSRCIKKITEFMPISADWVVGILAMRVGEMYGYIVIYAALECKRISVNAHMFIYLLIYTFPQEI